MLFLINPEIIHFFRCKVAFLPNGVNTFYQNKVQVRIIEDKEIDAQDFVIFDAFKQLFQLDWVIHYFIIVYILNFIFFI